MVALPSQYASLLEQISSIAGYYMRLTEVLRALEQSQSVYRREFCAFANERLTNNYYRELNELNEFRFLKDTDESLDGVFALTFANEHLRPCV